LDRLRAFVVGSRLFRLFFAMLISAVARIVEVSFCDLAGMRHSVEVPADSLYEAAALALAAFRRSLAVDPPGSATRLVVSVPRGEAERHEVKVQAVEEWLACQGRTPKEQALKRRLREA
jgi:hypothetical protein